MTGSKSLLRAAAATILLLVVSAPLSARNDMSGTAVVVSGYLASWKLWSGHSVSSVPADRITHLLYAFGRVSAAGSAELADSCVDIGECNGVRPPSGVGGAFARLLELKREYPRLRVLISFGGWTGSKYFSLAAKDDESRERLSRSLIDKFFLEYPGVFDGVDIDWEYPGTEGAIGNVVGKLDGENLTLLVKEIRRQLDRLSASDGRHYELSIAVPADAEKAAHFQFAQLAMLVDRFNVMSYDYYAGSAQTGLNAPLFASTNALSREKNVNASVRMFQTSGVPPEKLIVGLPFYGRAYANVSPKNDGLHQPTGPGKLDIGGEGGEIDYRDLIANRLEMNGFVLRRDAEARVPWLYNPRTRVWISYDDPESIREKSEYVRSKKLAGVVIWDLLADDGSLLPAVLEGLRTNIKTRVR